MIAHKKNEIKTKIEAILGNSIQIETDIEGYFDLITNRWSISAKEMESIRDIMPIECVFIDGAQITIKLNTQAQ